ncbi:hypothetical protein CCACVL1_27112, partial [Corchorus capsularis]
MRNRREKEKWSPSPLGLTQSEHRLIGEPLPDNVTLDVVDTLPKK